MITRQSSRPLKRLCVIIAICGAAILALGSSDCALAHSPIEAMADAANNFLASLDEQQRETATFEFDDKERVNWHFIPRERNGLSLKEMRTDQRQMAYALLQSPLSHDGLNKALVIMTLERVLHELENFAAHRDPELYFFSVFGKPSTEETWAWRVEGHHLSLNFTIVDGKRLVSSPSFFGSNPAEVLEGPRKGLRVLGREEDLGRQLAQSLSPPQRKVAIISDEAPRDIINSPERTKAQALSPAGLPTTELTESQSTILRELIHEYIHRLRPEFAEKDLERIYSTGFDKIHFAWAGGLNRGEGHYYRVQGPTFILEYDSTQNNANHVHLVWRDFNNDFGEDLLKRHYERSHNDN